jgi:hypothetical protein
LDLSKTLAQKGFAMSENRATATLKSLPDGIFGKMQFDVLLSYRRQRYHFLCVREENGDYYLCLTNDNGEKPPGLIAWEVYTPLPTLQPNNTHTPSAWSKEWMQKKCGFEDFVAKVYSAWFTTDTTMRHFRTQYYERIDDSFLAQALNLCKLTNRRGKRVWALIVESEPCRFRAGAKLAETHFVRLSKEDWLKKNYPELKELPKWRFPAVAG